MIVVGIDPSLTGTGLAKHNPVDPHGEHWQVARIKTTAPKVPSHLASVDRFDSIGREILAFCVGFPDVAVLEAPAYSSITGHPHERAGLWWTIYRLFAQRWRVPTLVIEPNLRIKYATGNARSGKDEVMLAAAKRYPAAGISNNDEADAVVLTAMGARIYGEPIETSLPKTHLDALKTLMMPPKAS